MMRVEIKKLGINKDYERVFLISDIHNHYKSYSQMRDVLNWNKNDLVIILGDIIDRGGEVADPLAMLNEVRFAESRNYDIIMLKGNHEKWLTSAISRYCSSGRRVYMYNSLDIILDKLSIEELFQYAEWMDQLPLGIEMSVAGYEKIFRLAHASTLDLSDEDECLLGSALFFKNALDQSDYISVIGHTVTDVIRRYYGEVSNLDGNINTDIWHYEDKLWCIDCGNGYREEKDISGKLGCIELSGSGKIKEHYI